MAKHTDAIRAALEKKKAAAHPDAIIDKDGNVKSAGKSTTGSMAPVIKPMKKVTGRGR